MTITEAGADLRAGRTTCQELTAAALRTVEELNPKLNAFITITADAAIERAGQLDAELAAGHDRGPLHGIPIAHKDLIFTKGVRTTCGSKLFENFVPDYDAPAVARLAAAGAVSLGKLGLHELAYGVTSTNPHFGPVRNPCNPECIPGGSSGGSGAAVAAGLVFMATGTDTGGSIRIPASYCGTVGFKPTYGLVDRSGVQPLAFSLDHVGPLTRTVRDAELVLDVLAGPQALPADRPIRIGLPANFYFDVIDPEVKAAVEAAARLCESLGFPVIPVQVPDIDALNAAAFAIIMSEASAVYESHLHRRDQFGADVLALLDMGTLVPATAYVNAQRLRTRMGAEFRRLFETIDVLLTPTIPIVAPRIGQLTVELGGHTLQTRMATTMFVRGFNVLGLPALSLPVGRSRSGMPIGAQLVGRAFEDSLVLKLGKALEAAIHSERRGAA